MANVTLFVDNEVLQRARRRALDEGTSVDAVVQSFLERYASGRDRVAAMRAFLDRAANSTARSERSSTRDELHER